jgi:hypothetical protein
LRRFSHRTLSSDGRNESLSRRPNLRGHSSYAKLKKLIRTLLAKPSAEVLVTSMIDLYNVPADFPGREVCDAHKDPWKRVDEMERFLNADIMDPRFIPYLQLHEFEALILTDARCLSKYYPKGKNALDKLAKSIEKQYRSPEEVNQLTPTSRRIATAVPEYQKTVFGVSAVQDLGIERIRANCKHFDTWLKRMEALFEVF